MNNVQNANDSTAILRTISGSWNLSNVSYIYCKSIWCSPRLRSQTKCESGSEMSLFNADRDFLHSTLFRLAKKTGPSWPKRMLNVMYHFPSPKWQLSGCNERLVQRDRLGGSSAHSQKATELFQTMQEMTMQEMTLRVHSCPCTGEKVQKQGKGGVNSCLLLMLTCNYH